MIQVWGIWFPDIEAWFNSGPGPQAAVMVFSSRAEAAANLYNRRQSLSGANRPAPEVRLIGDDGLPVGE